MQGSLQYPSLGIELLGGSSPRRARLTERVTNASVFRDFWGRAPNTSDSHCSSRLGGLPLRHLCLLVNIPSATLRVGPHLHPTRGQRCKC